ncbi:hypothetical protein [Salibacterium aidingense]|uniref:hypothetical protein n=1 Tax=Salibacterium aidingense TaxID=384933 RepID=UPI00041070C6|nr:hypothetical protein [Salibacterium aidingense]
MSFELKQKLQAILQYSIDNHQFERAEQAVGHLRELSEIEAFIAEERRAGRQTAERRQGARIKSDSASSHSAAAVQEGEAGSERTREGVTIYYIKEENLIKFKKPPQTYAVQVEFLQTFLENIQEWQGREAFSSKDYFDQFADSLQPYSTYQSSTLRQFITLLFRIAYQLGLLEKPTPPQRSRYVVARDMETEKVMNEIFEKKVVQL